MRSSKKRQQQLQEQSLIQLKLKNKVMAKSKSLEDLAEQGAAEVPLINIRDSNYLGKLYLGTPKSQAAILTFDSGSEFLAVASSLCYEKGSQEELEVPNGRVLSTSSKTCSDVVYDVKKSTSAREVQDEAITVSYGSAKLRGSLIDDKTCLMPVDIKSDASEKDKDQALDDGQCFNIDLIAMKSWTGIHAGTNGILGLSPKKDETYRKRHILWAMKNSGTIKDAMVSFSISQ